jgi:hypothetical protein
MVRLPAYLDKLQPGHYSSWDIYGSVWQQILYYSYAGIAFEVFRAHKTPCFIMDTAEGVTKDVICEVFCG